MEHFRILQKTRMQSVPFKQSVPPPSHVQMFASQRVELPFMVDGRIPAKINAPNCEKNKSRKVPKHTKFRHGEATTSRVVFSYRGNMFVKRRENAAETTRIQSNLVHAASQRPIPRSRSPTTTMPLVSKLHFTFLSP